LEVLKIKHKRGRKLLPCLIIIYQKNDRHSPSSSSNALKSPQECLVLLSFISPNHHLHHHHKEPQERKKESSILNGSVSVDVKMLKDEELPSFGLQIHKSFLFRFILLVFSSPFADPFWHYK